MSSYTFERNDWPTLGVEIELQLVDARSMGLRSAIGDVLSEIPQDLHFRIKPELMQSYLEINTEICRDVDQVERDLREKILMVEEAVAKHDLRLFWGGTHPFSPWYEQQVTPTPRYMELIELMQETARRLVTFGLHVHVGVDSGDKAVMICDRIMRYLPMLLAISVNSPFWHRRRTGLHSQRIKVIEGLPSAGLPPLMRNWSEYVWLLNHMIDTGFIRTIREIWWDVRPHHNFGTVEVRICDMPPDLPSVLAITALTQCLVHDLSNEIDQGAYLYDCHPMMVRMNKWRACRYGMDALLIDPYTQEALPARRVVRKLVEHLRAASVTLGCQAYLASVLDMIEKPTGTARQLAIFEQTGDFTEIVRQMLPRSTLSVC